MCMNQKEGDAGLYRCNIKKENISRDKLYTTNLQNRMKHCTYQSIKMELRRIATKNFNKKIQIYFIEQKIRSKKSYIPLRKDINKF